MFLVGGGIIAHGLPMVHDAMHTLAIGHVEGASLHGEPWWFTPLRMLTDAVVGVVVGLLAIGVAAVGRRARDRLTPPTRSA
jgi:predicted DNA repair protein MutK